MADTQIINGVTVALTPEQQAEKDAAVAAWAPSAHQVQAERERRLALGFDYDFQDARGVHRIGTTERDMKGWDEVTDLADALTAKSDTTTTIAIVTDTGPCTVTAPEWADIRIAAAAFRQPIWAASLTIMYSDPIPADYAADERWP